MRWFAVIFVCGRLFASAADFWITQNGAGSANGSSLGNAAACDATPNTPQSTCAAFNSAGHWGSGSGQIGSGTTIHLSGTITAAAQAASYMVFQGSGSGGQPITLSFENCAVLTAPSWGPGGTAITGNGISYIVIDGHGCGTVQTTANGTGLTYTDNDNGIAFGAGCSNCTIQNMIVGPMYVHAGSSDEGGQNSGGIYVLDGDNVMFQNNTVFDAHWCIAYAWDANHSSLSISSNTAYHCDHGIAVEGGTAFSLTGASASSNTIHDASNWDDAAVDNHHDGIHFWCVVNGCAITGVNIYSNYFYGDWGAGFNSWIYDEVEGTATQNNAYIFNNYGIDQSLASGSGCGYICFLGASPTVVNNTVVGASNTVGLCLQNFGTGTVTVENNVCSNVNHALATQNATALVWNYNDYYGIGSGGFGGGSSFALWQMACSCDGNSITTNPLLIAFKPAPSSPLIAAGVNLTSLGIVALDSDCVGVSRPASGAWDIGAYNYIPPPGSISSSTGIASSSGVQ